MKKISFIFACALAAASMSLVSCSSGNNKTATEETAVEETAEAAPADGVISLENDNQFRPDKAVSNVVVLDFNATWCIPCKKLTPAYHKAAEQVEGVKFYSVDIDKCPLTKEAFGVESVPTVVILKPDGTMSKSVGLGDFVNEEAMKAMTADQATDTICANLVKMIK